MTSERELALERELRRVTLHLRQVELAYHMYPSLDRPVQGCQSCAAVAAAQAVLDGTQNAQEDHGRIAG